MLFKKKIFTQLIFNKKIVSALCLPIFILLAECSKKEAKLDPDRPLNAEEKSDITYNGQTYKFRPTGNNTGIHELGEKFTMPNGEAAYPSICILNPDFEIIFQYNQLLSINDLRLLLNNLLKTI